MYEGKYFPNNLAYVLWKRGVQKNRWVQEVAAWCSCNSERASDLLRSKSRPTDAEMESLSLTTEVDAAQLSYGDLVEGTDVLTENLRFLLSSLEHGGLKRLAEQIDVAKTTVYKWKGGSQPPNKTHLLGIAAFFGLKPSTDLSRDPLFLSLDPIGARATREWLVERIQSINDEQLVLYSPALKRLLE